MSVRSGLLFVYLGKEEAVTWHEENTMSKCTGAQSVGGYLWEVESIIILGEGGGGNVTVLAGKLYTDFGPKVNSKTSQLEIWKDYLNSLYQPQNCL